MQLLCNILNAQMTQCDWQFASRIWLPIYPNSACYLDEVLDLQVFGQNTQSIDGFDTSVLNIVNMTVLQMKTNSTFNLTEVDQTQIIQNPELSSFYYAIDIGPNGVLKNAFVVVNTSFTVYYDPKQLYVSIINSFQGKLDNVTVTGFINVSIINNKTSKVYFSNLVGSAGFGVDKTVYPSGTPSFSFRNVSSTVRFFVNNVEISTNQIINQTEFYFVNCFDSVQLVGLQQAVDFTNPVIMPMLNQQTITYITESIQMSFNINVWYSVQTQFLNGSVNNNDQTNMIQDLYNVSFKQYLEKYYETKYLIIKRYDEQENELQMVNSNDPNIKQTVYHSEGKAVAIIDLQLIICQGRYVYSTTQKQCILRSACQNKLYNSICLITCPEGYYTFDNGCWFECPLWRGAYSVTGVQQCTQCPANMFANQTTGSCVASCKLLTFKQGCYSICPNTKTDGQNCVVPITKDDCAGKFFIHFGQIDSSKYYDQCTNTLVVSYTTQISNGTYISEYNFMCNYASTVSRLCAYNESFTTSYCPIKEANDISISTSFQCRQNCQTLWQTTASECQTLCPQFNYGNQYQICRQCMNDYDGGQYFDRLTSKCIKTCDKYSISGDLKVCEDNTPQFCKFVIICSNNSKICVSSCPSSGEYIYVNVLDDITECLSSCPSYFFKLNTNFKCILMSQCEAYGGFYIESNQFQCSSDTCISESGFYKVLPNGTKICTSCSDKYFEEELKAGARCSADKCSSSNGIFHLDASSNKICDNCSLQIYTDSSFAICSPNSNNCQLTGGIFTQQKFDQIYKKFCTPCTSVQEYIYGLECKADKCNYFESFYSGTSKNICSMDQCTALTQGKYQFRNDQTGEDKKCSACNGQDGFSYLTGATCSKIPCSFYLTIRDITGSTKKCSLNCQETQNIYFINSGYKICDLCSENIYVSFANLQCSKSNCNTETNGFYYQFNSSHILCLSQADCTQAGDYYINSFSSKLCSIDACFGTSNYYYKDSNNHKICKDCRDQLTSYYIDLNQKWCSNDACASETGGLKYYQKINGINICTNCSGKWFETSVGVGAQCSADQCSQTTNGKYRLDSNSNKICDQCVANIYFDSSLKQCLSSCSSTGNIFQYAADGIKKFCTLCNTQSDYLSGDVCSYNKCSYFTQFYDQSAQNLCSVTQCQSETNGIYQQRYGNTGDDLVCSQCIGENGFSYLTDKSCSKTECQYYSSQSELTPVTKRCSSTSCSQETNGIYYFSQTFQKICDSCNGAYLPAYIFKYGLECKNIPCQFFADYALKICSLSCAETNQTYYEDNFNKICTKCDGTVGGSTMIYKKENICSNMPCTFYLDFPKKICSVGTCQETNNSYFVDQQANKICLYCPEGQKMYNGKCYDSCPIEANFLQVNGKICGTSCNGQQIYQVGSQKNCMESCNSQYFLGVAENGYQICVNCSSDRIAQRSDNQCILLSNCIYFNSDSPVCESGLGVNCQKIVAKDANSFFCRRNCTAFLEYQGQCYSKCPYTTLVDVNGVFCVKQCQFYKLVETVPFCTEECPDFTYVEPLYHPTVSGCFSSCSAETLKTRTNSCVKNCKTFDLYPNPNFCETPGSFQCPNIRLVQAGIYVCTQCGPTEFFSGFECVLNCSQFVLNQNKQLCISQCGSYPKGYTEETFNDVNVKVCQESCPNYDTFTFLGTQKCIDSTCGTNGKYLEINQRCVQACASGMYFVNYSSTFKYQCYPMNASCERYILYGNMKECYQTCPLSYQFLNDNECMQSCDVYMNDPKSPTQKLCVSACGDMNPQYQLLDSNGRIQCISTCGAMFVQQIGKQFVCISFCQFYTWDGWSKICATTCDYYKIDSQIDTNSYLCGTSCSSINMVYNVIDSNGKNMCVSQCPSSFPFLNGTECKKFCQFVIEQQISDVSKYKCQSTQCTNFYQKYLDNENIQVCRQSCTGQTPYILGNQCVQNCIITDNKYVEPDSSQCIQNCSGEQAIKKNVLTNVLFCDSACDFYVDSGARTCSSAGTASYPYRQVYQQIVTNGVTTTRYQYVSSCPNNEYAVVGGVSVCQTCTLYELVGVAHKCVASCSASQVQFKYQCFTGLCKDIVGVGSSFYSGVDKKCSHTCGDHFVYDQISFQCSSTCPANSVYFVSGGQQICSSSCAGTNDYVTLDSRYAINGVGQCVQICPVGSFKELLQAGDTYKYCVSQCAGKQYKVVAGEQACVSACPVYEMEAGGVKRCYDSCGDSAQNKIQVVISGSETQCVSLCPPSHPFMAANGDLECIQTCPNLFYSLVGSVRKCLDSCSLNTSVELSFSVPSHQLCTGACGAQQMFLRASGSVGTCVEVCPQTKNYYDSNRECQSECVPKVYRIDGAQKQCMVSCYSPYTLISQDDDYTVCNSVCKHPTPFALLNNSCIELCPPGTYLHEFICKLKCPAFMKYSTLDDQGQQVCVYECPNKIFTKTTGVQTLFCQKLCNSPNVFRKDILSGQIECLIKCEPTDYQYTTGECSQYNCIRDPVNKFSQNMVCQFSCPDFVDLTDYSCKPTCAGSFAGYVQQIIMNQNVKVCYSTCSTKFIDLRISSQYNSVGVCVTYCAKNEILYQEPFSASQFYCTQKCSDANRFVQPDLVYCGNTCASTFFQQNETGHNFCISSCDMPLGRLSIYGITQCVVCPKYVSEVDLSCMATCDFFSMSLGAQICRMVGGTRNLQSCPRYTNNAAPFLCIQACQTLVDGDMCVKDCSETGKRFVPESGFQCVSSCPFFYEYQLIFGIMQPRCVSTCKYMLSSANFKECQRQCNSNTSLYVFGQTYCSNCSSTQKLLVLANKQFSCISTVCPEFTYSYSNMCSHIQCGQIQLEIIKQQMTGYICFEKFSYNYSSSIKTITNQGHSISQIEVSKVLTSFLLSNGSIYTINKNGLNNTNIHNAIQIKQMAIPPYFNKQLLQVLFKNGSIHSNGQQEPMDFTNETVKRIIGFFDPDDTDMSINYLLTDQNLYFRGSCKAGMCTKDADGNDFDTTFNGKTKFRSMWTKMNLAAAGFPFIASDIQDINDQNWSIIFFLTNGNKFIFGINNYGRLCSDISNKIVLTDLSKYDYISAGETTSLFSSGEQLYYCGASFGEFQQDFIDVKISPERLSLEFGELLGWSFSDNSIVHLSNIDGGFVIRTSTQVFGIGKCIAFDCFNFRNEQIDYSSKVQLLCLLSQNLVVAGSSSVRVQYIKQPLNLVYVNDTKIPQEEVDQKGVIDLSKTITKDQTGLKVAISITVILYVVAFFSVFKMMLKLISDRKRAALKTVKKHDVNQIVKMNFMVPENIFYTEMEYQLI
ncbi:Conserved_hypothetical protein [Hexamita inflata]|uniref:Transmembrane protein n=1 Tax=Hexamita inflata TaxID=28002 RepID=A0AA86PV52_9EUKA|nr:Conserved hypothetical protein [Hexamita inflata]